ncbi:MAG: TOMM precursor leader peptide-binding protein [Planctomycetaceae bacterium]|nr:TOMM precursor leader peptide-binding protein [Planctomycetaceae bacterium]
MTYPALTPAEQSRYEWQMWVRDFGETGQRRLKAASVLISRIGGVGGTVAMHLATAGVGRLVLAHAGDLRLNDLNRQLLMSTADVGSPRIESAARRLRELNPQVVVETVNENLDVSNVGRYVSQVDLVVSAAPLFVERLAMNRAAVRQRKPLVDCAMYDLEGRLITVRPGRTPCLDCLYPESPPLWKREFPVFGAVASTVASIAAMEVIKLLAGFGKPLENQLLSYDLREMSFQTIAIARRPDCPTCGQLSA